MSSKYKPDTDIMTTNQVAEIVNIQGYINRFKLSPFMYALIALGLAIVIVATFIIVTVVAIRSENQVDDFRKTLEDIMIMQNLILEKVNTL